ncbi:phage recombination protein Bet [Denitrobaculum tricleocarpae]|uniref:Phage recombination protein Bet n=1 Tax=Denitrobaculum tricleocarpae TaxID=2591009 RepID=A0A545TT96_9PROT|nr:phage recombination protein Bet [Denitrobaculum tricleocarpae]TQV80361.1 phage recombination protein Bet [Denitrobaculum tricleocarpae]
MNQVTVMPPMAPRSYTDNQLQLIHQTYAKDCTAQEFNVFIEVAKRYGLDPFKKQMYCNIYNKDAKPNDKKQRTMVFITAIDGFRGIAERTGLYRPDENEPEVTTHKEFANPDSNPLGIEKAVVTVWKMDQRGDWNPIKGVAYWDEFAPLVEGYDEEDRGETWDNSGNPKMTRIPNGKMMLDPKNNFWRKMGRHMLAKCAEAQALRRGWPNDMSGIYAPEEMAVADADEATAAERVERAEQERLLLATKTKDTIMIQWRAGDPLEAVTLGQMVDRCAAFIEQCASPTQLETWRHINKHSLQEFFARSKSDALEIKRLLEEKLKALQADEPETLMAEAGE